MNPIPTVLHVRFTRPWNKLLIGDRGKGKGSLVGVQHLGIGTSLMSSRNARTVKALGAFVYLAFKKEKDRYSFEICNGDVGGGA